MVDDKNPNPALAKRPMIGLPLFHDMGLIGAMIAPLLSATPVVFIPTFAFVQRPSVWMKVMDTYRATITVAPNFGFALAVTYPRAGNIGGGGFMLIHLAKEHRQTAIDYRETAPAATTPDVFLDAKGEPDPAKSRDSGLSVGIPGTVAGLALADRKYGSGKLSLA